MPEYSYSARDNSGELVSGVLKAANEEELVAKLHSMDYVPVKISEAQGDEPAEDILERFKRIKPTDMIMFNLQLANMIDAGLTLLSSLQIISHQTTNTRLKKVVHSLHDMISEGSSLSDALAKFPSVFSHLFINMVSAGETGGTLSAVLSRYATYVEEQEEIRQKVKGALLYPSILFFVGIAVIVFIVSFVMPKFIEIFLSANVPLPVPTIIIYNVGMTIKKFWWLILLVSSGIVIFTKLYVRTEAGKGMFDRIILKVPIIGPLARKILIARFSYALANLLESGVPLLQALDSTSNVVGNKVLNAELRKARAGVEKGEQLGKSLGKSSEFPPDVVQMITVGEDTGKIFKMLYRVAGFYEMIASRTIKKLTTLIEPLFVVIMGGMIGVIVPAMVLPLFDLVKTIQR